MVNFVINLLYLSLRIARFEQDIEQKPKVALLLMINQHFTAHHVLHTAPAVPKDDRIIPVAYVEPVS